MNALMNSAGNHNNAFGHDCGDSVTTGTVNNLFGQYCGHDITTGSNNCLFGHDNSAYVIELSTGSHNCVFGNYSRPSATDAEHQYVFGYNRTGSGDNTFQAGGSNGAYNEANSSTWSTTSDRRIKKNIVDNNIGLNAINQIRVRNFEYRTKDEITDFDHLQDKSPVIVEKTGTQIGVIAQEIQEVLPDVVKVLSTGAYTVDPDNLTWYLVNAVQELSAKNDELAAEVASLKSQINN
jgi:hypothetical protein